MDEPSIPNVFSGVTGPAEDESANEHRIFCDESALAASPAAWRAMRQQRRKTVRMPSRPEEPAPHMALVHVEARARPMVAARDVGRPHRVRLPGWLDPRLVLLAEPDSERAAAFRSLCDSLLAKGLPRVLAVSSAAPKDGKTTCAINLALALAERPLETVLLVDGNFSEPALARLFAIDEHTPTPPYLDTPWLAPFKIVELTPCLHVAAIVRRSGEQPARAEKHSLDIIVERLSALGYDRLIIDAPAPDGSAVVSRLLGLADAVLLAVRAGQTTTRALRRVVEQVGASKAIGSVLIEG